MKKTELYCDTCGNKVDKFAEVNANGIRVFKGTNLDTEVEMCQECHDSIQKFMKQLKVKK